MGEIRAKLPRLVSRPQDHDLENSGEFPSATESAGPASCASPRWPANREQCGHLAERQRVRLIADVSKLLHDPCCPDTVKDAGLTLIGWLARRQPGEEAHGYGVPEAANARARRRR